MLELTPEDSSLARKRRIEKLRQGNEANKKPKFDETTDETLEPDETMSDPHRKPSICGIKKQARYEPGVPMTREQLAIWRKEARRVRNRESAAASRQKTRERIEELEGQIEDIMAKYESALQRIIELESGSNTTTPQNLMEDIANRRGHLISPISSPIQDLNISFDLPEFDLNDPMISRPTAVCV